MINLEISQQHIHLEVSQRHKLRRISDRSGHLNVTILEFFLANTIRRFLSFYLDGGKLEILIAKARRKQSTETQAHKQWFLNNTQLKNSELESAIEEGPLWFRPVDWFCLDLGEI